MSKEIPNLSTELKHLESYFNFEEKEDDLHFSLCIHCQNDVRDAREAFMELKKFVLLPNKHEKQLRSLEVRGKALESFEEIEHLNQTLQHAFSLTELRLYYENL